MKTTLNLLCLSTLLSVAGFAGVQPLSVIVMEAQGLGPRLIGLLSSLIFGGVLLLAPVQPALVGRFGAMRTYQAGKILAVGGFALCAAATTPWIWAAAFVLIGFAGALTWPLTDSLLATAAPPDRKGAWLGLFQAGMGVAFALGPFAAALFAASPRVVFLGAGILAFLSSLPLLGGRLPEPEPEREDDLSGIEVWRGAATLGLIALLGGLFENGTHTAGTLVALAQGWAGTPAVALAGVMATGSFLVQRPLGRAADRRGMWGLLLWGLATLAVSLAALPLIGRWPALLWGLGLIWGAGSGCLYTLAMTGTAQTFAGRQVAAATTVMVLGYTVGSAVGPILGGLAVAASPLGGVPWVFGTLALAGWLVAWARRPAHRVG